MKIIIIGRGRLGKSLVHFLEESPFEVQLQGHLDIPQNTENDIVWLTVPDDSISTMSQKISQCKLLLHSSGSLGLDALEERHNRGVIHPIMTFSGIEEELPKPPIPATIQCDNETDLILLHQICSELQFTPYYLPLQASRSMYHAAAVVGGNFSMLLYELATQLLIDCGLSETDAKSALLPLIQKGIKNLEHNNFANVITGPSVRKDMETMNRHKQVLAQLNPRWEALYSICSTEIEEQIKFQNSKKKSNNKIK